MPTELRGTASAMKDQSASRRKSAKPGQRSPEKRSKSAKGQAKVAASAGDLAEIGLQASAPLRSASALWSAAQMESLQSQATFKPPQDHVLEACSGAMQAISERMQDYLRATSGRERQDALAVLELLRAAAARLQRMRSTDELHRAEAACYGVVVRERRLAAGLSQPGLARRAGVSVNTIKNVESGKIEPTLVTQQRLARVPEMQLQEPAPIAAAAANSSETPNSWIGPRYDAGQMLDDLIETCNLPRGELDQTYLYIEGQSAKDWLKLCNAPTYLSAFRNRAPIEDAARHCAELLGQGPVRIAGLGSGDGKAETRFTSALCDALGPRSPAALFLLDISHTLICSAFKHAYEHLAGRVDLLAMHANFHDLSRCPPLHEERDLIRPRRVYTLLGATLANLRNEIDLFSEVSRWTRRGDLLVIDFQLTRAPASDPAQVRASEPPLIHGPSPTHHQWLTGPLRRHCEGAQEVKLRMDLNTHGAVPGCYELLCMADVHMQSKEVREFLVWRLKRYDPEQLGVFLQGKGWEPSLTLRYGQDEKPAAAVMVLQRK